MTTPEQPQPESKQETTEQAFEKFLADNGWVSSKVSKHDYREIWLAATERAVKRIEELQNELRCHPISDRRKAKPSINCIHSSYWTTIYGNCMACDRDKLNSQLTQRNAELLELREKVKDTEEKLSWYVLNSNVQIDE